MTASEKTFPTFQGKVAVVTGAARGIGRAVAVAFAQHGADVAGVDICATVDPRSGVTPATRDDLDRTGKLVEAAGGRWISFVADQRDLPALRDIASKVQHGFGGDVAAAHQRRVASPANFDAAEQIRLGAAQPIQPRRAEGVASKIWVSGLKRMAVPRRFFTGPAFCSFPVGLPRT